ncbi:MAG: ADP-forming succinate--CoA ligase subunit beta [Aigarchaeota archaeon]|nr:ADP-forming succinate--CoA ligase subunit beta [Aigarchaeota archaeon]MCX8192440.1 ADP-forming succinate--CoA ligase subunit beta [Nitrososphaeria archaeon]MDW7986646.1 ADP-forming succinate--CoA ligase subunit beta [Nitrososphaerota archaeon]
MKLYEYEARNLFREQGIPVPEFRVVSTAEEALKAAEEIGGRLVVKAQVLVAGRGKAGGVKLAENPEEAYRYAKQMLGSEIKGELVKKVLISKAVDIDRELYLSIIVDRSIGAPVILSSPEGGVDIEELARSKPEKILKIFVDPVVGIREYHAREAARFLDLDEQTLKKAQQIVIDLYKVFEKYSCELAEINPLALTPEGSLVAIDAKIILDDNALYKYPEFSGEYVRDLSYYEAEAKKMNFSYVELDGNIGILCNGAGLTMATMDSVYILGGKPANFLDIGGGARADLVERAVSLLLKHPRTEVLFINILGGITRCDEVARGIVEAIKKTGVAKKMVVRLKGTNEEEGRRILEENGIYVLEEMDEAARKAVQLGGAI